MHCLNFEMERQQQDGARLRIDQYTSLILLPFENETTNSARSKDLRGGKWQTKDGRSRAALVLSLLKGETTAAEAARRHGLKVAEVEEWARTFSVG